MGVFLIAVTAPERDLFFWLARLLPARGKKDVPFRRY